MPKKKSGAYDNKTYQNDYHKAMKTKLISFNPNDPEDMKIWDFLMGKGKGNVTAYIKDLIREDITRELEHSWYDLDEEKKRQKKEQTS